MLEEDGPAQNAGLWIEDIIIGFGNKPVTSVDDLQRLLTQFPVGLPVSVALLRDGRLVERTAVPGEYPNPVRG
ncbi:MAG: PDZ domain-containing protein, partial [Planctomycetia bacterium]|nr:PDZ domain-containing protein [Planctomycetia bacterium]